MTRRIPGRSERALNGIGGCKRTTFPWHRGRISPFAGGDSLPAMCNSSQSRSAANSQGAIEISQAIDIYSSVFRCDFLMDGPTPALIPATQSVQRLDRSYTRPCSQSNEGRFYVIKKILSVCSVLVLASATFAKADAIGTTAIYSLTFDNCTGTCGTSPFGTIQLIQTATGVVTVTETLKATTPAEGFVATGAGKSLEFNLSGDPVITIANLTSGFAVVAPGNSPSLGTFDYAVSCAGISCGPGGSIVNPGPLSFTVTDATGVNVSDFTANGAGLFFLSDIIGMNGNTGEVGATGGTITPPSVPEPSSLLLFGTGLAAAAGLVRRRVVSAIKSN
jgi:hypothetical protein